MNGALQDNYNFQSVGTSALVLFMMSTGDNFNSVMKALSKQYSIDYQCIENPTYEDYIRYGKPVGCGKPEAVIPVFITFVGIVIFIFLNLFIAIIVQGYEENIERNNN